MRTRRLVAPAAAMFLVLLCAACTDDDAAGDPPPDGSAGTEHGSHQQSPSPEPAMTPPLLLPDLRSLPAEDIGIRQAEDADELRFAAALANEGDGPLVLRPDDAEDCPNGQRHASQVVFRDMDGDGAFDPETDTRKEVFPAGCMLFHPDHDHWHFDASASYVLTRPGDDEPVAATEKVSFCMRDSRRLPGAQWADVPERFDECERDTVQGITPGWADVYAADLEGQALPLPDDIADGVYCLALTADPFGLIRETDSGGDNTSVVAIELADGKAARHSGEDVCDPAASDRE